MTHFERPTAMTFATQASTGAFYNKLLTKLEGALDDIQNQVTDLAAVQADLAAVQAEQAAQLTQILAAQAAADAAAADAATAQGTADTVRLNDAISSSYVSPGIVMQSTDAGATATISIANHTRHYADGTSVSVTTGSITGLAYATTYYVYYDDASRAGGGVSYLATTDAKLALPPAATGRHFVGTIITASSGGPITSGGYAPPPAGGSIDRTAIL